MNSLVLEYQIFVRLIIDISILRCGYPCSHVLKIINELMLDMIKVQHWKGSTKCTLCGIVLFKLNSFFSHVFACP